MRKSRTLSEAGQFFYPEAVKTLEHALLAEDKTHAHLLLRANHLLIGHSTYLAPKLLAIIRQLEFDPPSPVHIEHRSGFTADIVRRVLDGTLHAGFRHFPIQHPDLLSGCACWKKLSLYACLATIHWHDGHKFVLMILTSRHLSRWLAKLCPLCTKRFGST